MFGNNRKVRDVPVWQLKYYAAWGAVSLIPTLVRGAYYRMLAQLLKAKRQSMIS